MQKRIIIYILTICSLVSACEFDYYLDKDPSNFTPKVVLNALINPADDIIISIRWSRHYTQSYPRPKPNGKAKLYENDTLVNETAIDKDGDIFTYYKAKAGKSYKIIVDVEDYGIVEAETMIPNVGRVQAEFLEKRNTAVLYNTMSYYHSQLNEITTPHLIRAVWVRAKVVYKFKNEYEDLRILGSNFTGRIHTNNLYVDNFNVGTYSDSYPGETNVAASGGVLYYKKSIRIPYQLIKLSQPLMVATLYSDSITTPVQVADHLMNVQNDTINIPVSDVAIEVIYPSDDFDKYVKGVYRQSELIFDSSIFPLFAETVYIHSNVKNGLGIFAGYNSIKLDLPIKEKNYEKK